MIDERFSSPITYNEWAPFLTNCLAMNVKHRGYVLGIGSLMIKWITESRRLLGIQGTENIPDDSLWEQQSKVTKHLEYLEYFVICDFHYVCTYELLFIWRERSHEKVTLELNIFLDNLNWWLQKVIVKSSVFSILYWGYLSISEMIPFALYL